MKYELINGKILDGTKDMTVKEEYSILVENDKGYSKGWQYSI